VKRLHKIGDIFVLQINKHEKCVHPVLKMSKNSGEKICAKCGRSIYILSNSENPIHLVISENKKENEQ
jgi:hypothetical protein